MCTNLNLTDIESGYKVFKRAVIEKVRLEEVGVSYAEPTRKARRSTGRTGYGRSGALPSTLAPGLKLTPAPILSS
jgi:hypothetical protein